jgi:hypothetical protein
MTTASFLLYVSDNHHHNGSAGKYIAASETDAAPILGKSEEAAVLASLSIVSLAKYGVRNAVHFERPLFWKLAHQRDRQ